MSALTYGWDSETRMPESFWVRFKTCSREVRGWKEEIFAAARTIANEAKKPLWICASGGIDSEIACRAFYEQGINFSVLSLEYSEGVNHHDIRYAIEWCRAHGVPHTLVPFDIKKFLISEIDVYANQYAALHPFRYLQLRLLEFVEERGGYAVLGGGEQLYAADESVKITEEDVYLPLSNGNIVPLEWCRDQGTVHEPYFHASTPELLFSYMQVPIIDFALRTPDPILRHEANVYSLKRIVYQSEWPDLAPRVKAHGFEKIRTLYDESRDKLRLRFNDQYVSVHAPVRAIQRQLTDISAPKMSGIVGFRNV